MTLIIGWICDDGILLAADDEATVERTGIPYVQRYNGEVKLEKVGLNCAIGITGKLERVWGSVVKIIRPYADNDPVDASEIAQSLQEEANEHFKDERDLAFLIGGYMEGSPSLHWVFHAREGAEFEAWLARRNVQFAGVSYLCQFFQNYFPSVDVRTMSQAKILSAIYMTATCRDVMGGVGEIGSIAEIAPESCLVTSDEAVLKPLRKIGHQLQAEWQQSLARLVEAAK